MHKPLPQFTAATRSFKLVGTRGAVLPNPPPGAVIHHHRKGRSWARDSYRAFRKRVKKRRAKKGYR